MTADYKNTTQWWAKLTLNNDFQHHCVISESRTVAVVLQDIPQWHQTIENNECGLTVLHARSPRRIIGEDEADVVTQEGADGLTVASHEDAWIETDFLRD